MLQFLANNLRGNVRELEGAIHSLRHYARVTGQPVFKELARDALGELLRHAVRVVRVADVEAAVSRPSSCRPGRCNRSRRRGRSATPGCWRFISPASTRRRRTGRSAQLLREQDAQHGGGGRETVRDWLEKNEAIKAGDRAWKAKDLLDKVEREVAEVSRRPPQRPQSGRIDKCVRGRFMSQPWYADGLRFACTQCGNCCTGTPGFVWVNDEEIAALAEFRGEPVEEVRGLYTRSEGGTRRSLEGEGRTATASSTTARPAAPSTRFARGNAGHGPFWESNTRARRPGLRRPPAAPVATRAN